MNDEECTHEITHKGMCGGCDKSIVYDAVVGSHRAVFKVKNFERIPVEVRDEIEHEHLPVVGPSTPPIPCNRDHYKCYMQNCYYCMRLQHFEQKMTVEEQNLFEQLLKAKL